MELSLEGNREIVAAVAAGQYGAARRVASGLIRGSWRSVRAHPEREGTP